MHNFNVTLKESDIVVPNTGMITHHDTYSGDTIMPTITIVIAILALLTVFSLILFRKRKTAYRIFDQAKNLPKSFKLNRKARVYILPFCLVLVCFAFVSLFIGDKTSNPDSASAASNALTITIDDINLEAELEKGESVFKFTPASVKVAASSYGYTLSAYTKSAELTNSSLTDPTASVISSVAGTNEVLKDNNWGIAFSEPTDITSSVWQPLSAIETSSTILKDVSTATPADDETVFYYGVNVNDELELGIYSTVIVYTAVAKVVPCPAGNVCYDDNGANSPTTMGNQAISDTDTEITFWASNYQYQDTNQSTPRNITIKGFAGWNTKADGTGTSYGPNETITKPANLDVEGLRLYAMWVDSKGALQGWQGCSVMNIGDVTALTDNRDNNAYAVAKLADGKCWMIENLRLGSNSTIDLTPADTAISSNLTFPASTNTFTTSSYTSIEMNAANTLSPVSNMTTPAYENLYSYGNYYSWAAAIGRNINIASGDATTSICPKGWHLPTGNTNGEFYSLNTTINSGSYITSAGLRRYPANFVRSGYVFISPGYGLNEYGYYWSSTVERGAIRAYALSFDYSDYVFPGTAGYAKYWGLTVRCIAGS